MHKKTHEPDYYHAKYLARIIRTENLRETLKNTRKVLEKCGASFDAIAFRGMSGAMLAPTLALRMNKTLLMVRKPNDGSHSPRPVEGDKAARRYVIVDDLVDSGRTVRAIWDEVKTFAPGAVCIGVVEVNYLHHGLRDLSMRCCCHDSHVCEYCTVDRVRIEQRRTTEPAQAIVPIAPVFPCTLGQMVAQFTQELEDKTKVPEAPEVKADPPAESPIKRTAGFPMFLYSPVPWRMPDYYRKV